jgi:hypothetical protein
VSWDAASVARFKKGSLQRLTKSTIQIIAHTTGVPYVTLAPLPTRAQVQLISILLEEIVTFEKIQNEQAERFGVGNVFLPLSNNSTCSFVFARAPSASKLPENKREQNSHHASHNGLTIKYGRASVQVFEEACRIVLVTKPGVFA